MMHGADHPFPPTPPLQSEVISVVDPEIIRSLIQTAIDTALTLSPLALVVLALLVPYIYRIIFLRARVDRRPYEQTRSRTAPIVRKMRKRLDFEARHWRDYIANPRRNLKYRVEVSLFYDLAKAAAAYHASGEWEDYMHRQGILHPVFIDEQLPLSENLEKNGFFHSRFFEEGVANRYLMRRTPQGFAAVDVQRDRALKARATALFKEAIEQIEPEYEQGHIHLPFLKLSRWERVRFRIHTLIITKLLSDGMQKGLALALSYGLVHLLKGQTVSRGVVDFIMDIVALLFMTHVFDSIFSRRYSHFKTAWEDRERFYYRRQLHQFIIGLDEDAARAERRNEKEALQLLGNRTGDRRGLKRVHRAIKQTSYDPRQPGRLLAGATDVLDYAHQEATAIMLVLLKELAANSPDACAKVLKRLQRRRRPWRDLDTLLRILIDDFPCRETARLHGRALPSPDNLQEWQRAIRALQRDFPEEIDRLRCQRLLEQLKSPKLTPENREALILAYFIGGLLWRLRLIDPVDPLARRRDARLYHATRACTLPALQEIHALIKNGQLDCALEPTEITSIIHRIHRTLPLPACHRLRRELATRPELAAAEQEIVEMIRVKQSPTRSTLPELSRKHLQSWLDDTARDEAALEVTARAIHRAYRSVIAPRLEAQAQSDHLLLDPRILHPLFNPRTSEFLRGQLARRRLDGSPNQAVVALLGFFGDESTEPAALGAFPIRLSFLDLQPVLDYLTDQQGDPELLEELTHQALVEFYRAARMVDSVLDLPDALIRPSEGEDAGGAIARQMAIIRSFKARLTEQQEPQFLLTQQALHELDVILNPLHASLDFLLDQATRIGGETMLQTRRNLFRLQDPGRAMLIPLTSLARGQEPFSDGAEGYWKRIEPDFDQEKFLRQFDVNGREHAEAIIHARILLQHCDALRALLPASGDQSACVSFDALAGDADLLKISAAIVIAMIDQSGLRSQDRFRRIREVLAHAMNRQGFCKRGNLSDLVRVTLKERDAFGNTVHLRRPRPGGADTHFLRPVLPSSDK